MNIDKEDLLLMKLFQSQLENQRLKIDLAKSKLENLDITYKVNATSFNTYMQNIYSKYELSQEDEITVDGDVIRKEKDIVDDK